MSDAAYAIHITEENMWAIASEHPKFDPDKFSEWLGDHHEEGYFLRDPSSIFDCKYFSETVFFEMYKFEKHSENDLFRRVLKI